MTRTAKKTGSISTGSRKSTGIKRQTTSPAKSAGASARKTNMSKVLKACSKVPRSATAVAEKLGLSRNIVAGRMCDAVRQGKVMPVGAEEKHGRTRTLYLTV